MRTATRLAPTAALALAALLALAAPLASAHAEVESSDPANGQRMDEAPTMVHVTLSQAIEQGSSSMQVTDQSGARVDEGDLAFAGSPGHPELSVHLRPGLGPGAYTITVHTISGDSHPVTHVLGFAVGAFDPPAASGTHGIPPEAAVGRALMFAGFAAAFGATAMAAWMRAPAPEPATVRRAILLGAILHLAGAALLLHYTSSASGLGLRALTASPVGRSQYVRVVLGVAAVAMLGVAQRARRAPAVATALLLAGAVVTALGSHASTHGPAQVALDLVHLLATTTWVGALAVLLRMAAKRAALPVGALRAAGRRFGTIGLAAVVVLFATGSILSATILGADALLHPSTLLSATYGRILVAKVLLALAMVALAGVNRYVLLEPATTAGMAGGLQRLLAATTKGRVRPLAEGGPTTSLRRIIMAEAGLGVLVLALAGILTAISPGIAQAAPDQARLDMLGEHHSFSLTFLPNPTQGASGMAHLTVRDDSGALVANNTCGRPEGVSCAALVLVRDGASDRHALMPDGEGGWMAHDLLWRERGEMTARIEISTADVFSDSAEARFTVA